MPDLDRDFPGFLADESLHEAYELEIQSKEGKRLRFGELIAGKGDSVTTIVVFVRHFFCVYDQSYVRTLASQMMQNLLSTLPGSANPAQVIIIGCGDHSLIVPYMEETGTELPIYSDSSGELYEKLQMTRTMDGFTTPPPYTEASFVGSFATCLKQMWRRGWAGLRGGNWGQQGGEWIFQDGRLRYAHRMEGDNDHLTAEELVEILRVDQGLEKPEGRGGSS
ncbi:hypothetical protein N7456_012892 [Penicillium angulare]|uniref:Thioredoxin domain-containing protein n=1 Tax=Penicillium angulare TaxID=116970 RepID=A0A9W9EKN2_9EURO|nr:hypothetical protein N7456_012892 [Penicillium angulare]